MGKKHNKCQGDLPFSDFSCGTIEAVKEITARYSGLIVSVCAWVQNAEPSGTLGDVVGCHINFQFFSFSFGPLSDPGVVCWRTKSVLRSVRANIRRETFPQCARREEEERVLLFWYCWGVREPGKETAMGRKKIQITRIMDERNRQVSGTEITVHLYIYVCLCLI